MKAVILAGGFGTRISEETTNQPKPMITIGDRPIIWHIMKMFNHHGIDDFIICCGYKGYVLKEFFANYYLHTSDFTIDLQNNDMNILSQRGEQWRVTLVDTGVDTQTGGRLKRIRKYVDETFLMTYGDGVSDLNIRKLINHHKKSECLATVTSVQPPGRFGALEFEGNQVAKFVEKAENDAGWINGGFFALEPEVFDYIEGDFTAWEAEPVNSLVKNNQLSAYKHSGFWRPMDTLRDRVALEKLWKEGVAPWKVW